MCEKVRYNLALQDGNQTKRKQRILDWRALIQILFLDEVVEPVEHALKVAAPRLTLTANTLPMSMTDEPSYERREIFSCRRNLSRIARLRR